MDLFALKKKLRQKGITSKEFIEETIDVTHALIDKNFFPQNVTLVTFAGCKFEGSEVLFEEIRNKSLIIRFIDCAFDCYFSFSNCFVSGLHFIDTQRISQSFEISGSNVSRFYFKSSKKESENLLNGNVTISGNHFTEKVDCENLIQVVGQFVFTNNKIQSSENDPEIKSSSIFKNATLSNCDFSRTFFGKETQFDGAKFIGESSFQCYDSYFEKAYFNAVDFGKTALFNGSGFRDYVIFNNCRNLGETIGDFSGCSFEKDVYFDFTRFNDLTIKNVVFAGKASFANCTFQKLDLNQLVFEKPAFFDEIEILNLKECDKKTLRSIKQELQRTNNRIDYNKFKAYELDAYNSELRNRHWRDKFILWLNSISSKHGLDWVNALVFTFCVALLFYIPYFILENFSYELEISPNSINYFLTGYFKFLIPSYVSPFENGLSKWFQFIPFISGKIFIAYGIYQTIVSFRKYRI